MIGYLISVLLILLAAIPARAGEPPELHISSRGEVHIINAQIADRHALNLFSVAVWGQRWVVPVDQYTVLEDVGGATIDLSQILNEHRLEIKGRAVTDSPSQQGWLNTRLVRDLSIGTPPPPPTTAAAWGGLTITPPPPPQSSPPTSGASQKSSAIPAPAKLAPQLTKDLKPDMRGSEVIALQEFLQRGHWGIPNDGPVTGYYGKSTIRALKNFQTAHGLPPEGEVGPKTRAAINKLLFREP